MAEEWNTEDMLGTYLFENTQLLENLQGIVLEQQDADCFDEDSINEIFRTMHTIKGSSAIMKFDGITKTAHKLEDIFFCLRESHPQNVPHVELITHVLDVADFISEELEKIQDGGEADGDSSSLIAELDKFLNNIKEEPVVQKTEQKTEEKTEETAKPEQQHIYIPPKAAEGSHFYILNIEYQPELELVNIHAFKLVHKLKGIAENLKYFPEDVITNEESAKKILENGFRVFLQTYKVEKEIRDMMSFGYDIKNITVTECTRDEFQEALESLGVEVHNGQDADSKGAEKESHTEKTGKTHAPGDFVIKPQESARNTPEKQEEQPWALQETPDEGYLGILAELIVRLEYLEYVVIENPDLRAPGLRLDRFHEAACMMSAVSSDIKHIVESMGAVLPEEERVKKQVVSTLGYDPDVLPEHSVEYENEDEFFEDEPEEEEEETLRNKYMTFKSGNEYFGFKISYVTEVIIYQAITRIPECADYIRGIIHLRGKVVPVIDVRMRFGQAPLEYNDKTCIIAISFGEHMVGLMVEQIAEVVELPKDKLLPPPKVGWSDGVKNQYVYAVGKVGDSIKLLIDPRKLLTSREMASVVEQGTACKKSEDKEKKNI